MDIRSDSKYPANKLSNFAAHTFVIDDVLCRSFEGFLQSLKFQNPEMQLHVCGLIGLAAKRKGQGKKWQRTGQLYWQDTAYDRFGPEYQDLLDRAYGALADQSISFQRALKATGDAVLRHSIGKKDPKLTVLTEAEFVHRLTRLRKRLQEEVALNNH